MILLSWNCQGLGSPCTVHALGELLRTHKPSLVFLAETKCKKNRIETLKRKFDLFGCCVESQGRSRGLALLWHKSISVQLQSFGHHHIDATVYPESETEAWRFTGFYGFADVACRQRSWDLLSTLKNQSRRAWLIAGDFNEILDDSEKIGGRPRPLWQVRRFREALVSIDVFDLGFEGEPFTWCNRHPEPDTIVNGLIGMCRSRHKFPNIASADCEQVIREGWNTWAGNGQASLAARQRGCAARLQAWSNSKGSHSFKRQIRLREKDLENIRLQPISAASKIEESKIRADIERLLSEEEVYWKQRGKVHWLKEGDRNTSYFHNRANTRRRSNDITRIKNGDGQWLEQEEEIRDHIETYFGEIFRSRNPSEEELEKGTEAISGRLSEQLLQELSRPYTAEEISKALSQMAPLKSPGPDGMPPFFFQKYWHIVKKDVISTTLALLNDLNLPPGLNHTHIALIPKCKKPETLTQFRPISLCNVVYKIASKSIANRLKPLLDNIISSCQAAFVPGRLITDNVLLAFEVNHYLNTKRWGEKGHMALKLDISKAYDKVEWKFLEKVLARLGFPPKFTALIMLCVSSVSYSFILCGSQFGSVIPQRGLRQGDPLSPYLFLLCTEAFSALLQRAARDGRLQGVAVCRQAPRVSHLLFADDTLIFCQATVEAALCILEVLDIFGRAAGQEINFAKSSVVFSRNTIASLRDVIQGILDIRVERRHDLYLGLPSIVGKTRRSVFQSIRDRVWNRINGWNERNLSQAGKEILIKAVAQAIPTYAMGCFRLPLSLVKEIQSMVANFWWHNGETRKIHWINWRKLCKPKSQGGMGFRDLQAFNLALLSKQLWRIISNPDSLLSRVLRAKYFPDGQALLAPAERNPSYTWRSIQAAQQVVRGGLRWRICSGRSVRIWGDPWIPRPFSFSVLSSPNAASPDMRVCDLIDATSKEWNHGLLRELFWQEDIDAILAIPLSLIDGEDFFIWHHTSNGLFSVRSAYHVALSLAHQPLPSSSNLASPVWKTIWKANVPSKIRVFIWKVAHNAIPTGRNLLQKLRFESPACPLCCSEDEDVDHVFLRCPFARQISVSPGRLPLMPSPSRWSPPERSVVMLNFDGATFASSSEFGLGVIARNSFGECIGWKAVRKKGLHKPEMVEAFAAREAILLARRFSWKEIILEGDCATLYFKLSSSQPDCSDSGTITRDIKFLASGFDSCSFSLIRRTGNKAAHCLARQASSLASEGDYLPPLLSAYLLSDED
ncbi:UNVERIFIED_CONTAM: putative mitochondrial protein [Sesamum radiatum]|uniref:Mitochondrial protein n=1 Tax=Sesamum radiatum TaxID=300843 RepID=A0AAW2UMH9_SESRA